MAFFKLTIHNGMQVKPTRRNWN